MEPCNIDKDKLSSKKGYNFHYGNDSKELRQIIKNRKFVSDFNYDSDGNFKLGVSFLATVLKQENDKKQQQRIDIRYKPKTLPRRLEVKQIRLWC